MEVAVRLPCGDFELEGRLVLPRDPALAVVLCHPHPLHGGDLHSPPLVWIRDAVAAQDAAVLRFNFRGTGASGGVHGGGIDEVRDVEAAVRFLGEKVPGARLALVGYSFGAAVAARAALRVPGIDGLGLIAPPLADAPLPPLRTPALSLGAVLVAGDSDPLCPVEAARHWAQQVGAHLVVLPATDHFLAGAREPLGRIFADWIKPGAA